MKPTNPAFNVYPRRRELPKADPAIRNQLAPRKVPSPPAWMLKPAKPPMVKP